MTIDEIKALVKTLKECGVKYYKTNEITLEFSPESVPCETIDAPQPKIIIPLDAPVEPSPEIKDKIEEMKSLFRTSDQDLVDRLFPDHADYGSDEESINEAS